jgi:pimeloyl-ACP methyl ester carboxylesterase
VAGYAERPTAVPLLTAISFEYLPGDGVRLHVARAGVGPLVVLLHGFPEHWYSWRRQIPALASAGYSVLAPDLRGFNRSDAPVGIDGYRIERLVADVTALVRASGHDRAHIVGHDWGGLVAWFVAATRPDMTATLTIVNAPHPTLYRRQLWRTLQFARSAYVPFFLTPRLPEWLLSAGDGWMIRQMFLRGSARPGAFPREELDTHVAAALRPGALTAGLNYYRANVGRVTSGAPLPRIQAPTLVVWGERDPALGIGLLEGLETLTSSLHIVRLPDVGHWVQTEAPEALAEAIRRHISTGSLRPST